MNRNKIMKPVTLDINEVKKQKGAKKKPHFLKMEKKNNNKERKKLKARYGYWFGRRVVLL